MDWNRDLGLVVINLLMLSILILLIKKRNILEPFAYYMIAAMSITYIIDVAAFIIRLSKNIDRTASLYLYTYGGLGVFFLVVFFMYPRIIINKSLKFISKFVAIIYILSYCYQIYHFDISAGFPKNILFINAFLLLFVVVLFLLDTFKTDLILEISHYYPFWFSLGLVIIYLGIVPSIIISDMPNSKITSGLWSVIMFVVNFVGYGVMFYGLMQAKKLEK